MATEKSVKLQGQLNALITEMNTLIKDGTKASAELLAKIEATKAQIAVQELKEQKVQLMEAAKYAADLNERSQAHITILNQNLAIQRAQIEADKAKGKLSDEQYVKLLKELQVREKSVAATERVGQKTKEVIAAGLGVSSAWEDTFLGSLITAEGGIDQLGKAIADTMTPANMLGSTLMKVQEATVKVVFATDSATASFNQATGAAGAFDSQMFDAYSATNQFGVSMEDAAAVTTSLRDSFSGFNSVNAVTQTALIKSGAEMTALGISAQTAGQTLGGLQSSLGMNAKQAIATQRSLATAALEIGMAPSEMADGFNKAMPVLAQFGKQAPAIFKKVAAASKGLNISMDSLMGQIEGMDTFEGAAKAAGKLNSVLGGPLLNSMDLLGAEGADKVRLVIQAVEQSGRSFESMGRQEKKALALAAGFDNVADAASAFAAGTAGFDRMQDSIGSTSDEQERLEAAQAAGVSIMEKMQAIFNSFAMAVMPIVDGIRFLLDGVLSLNDAMGGMLVPVLIGVLGVIWAISMASKVAAAFSAAWNTVMGVQALIFGASSTAKTLEAAANTGVAATAGPAAAGQAALGASAAAGVGPQLLFAFAIGLVAIGLGLMAISVAAVVWGFVTLIKAFMEAPIAALQAAGALVVVGIAIAALVGIFTALAPVAPIAMASMMMIGYGLMFLAVPMLIFAAAFGIFAMAISTLSGEMAGAMALIGLALVPFALGLLIAAPAMFVAAALFAPAAILIGAGLMMLGIGIGLIVDNASELPAIGMYLAGFAIGLLAAAIPLYFAAGIIGPGALLLGAGLFMLGLGITMLVDNAGPMATLGFSLAGFAAGLLVAAPMLYFAGLIIGPAAALLGAGLIVLGLGLMAMDGSGSTMQEITANILPMAQALMMAAPFMLVAGLYMMLAGVPFLLGATFIALGMALLSGPLTQFATAMAIIAPFASVLGAIASGLLMLGFALPVFGLGLLLLGIFASLPFFDTGLETLTEALYIFADAMSGIPTEKAIALGQVFAGLAAMTDMEGMGNVLLGLAFGIGFLGTALWTLPSAEYLNGIAVAIASFGTSVATLLQPAAEALNVAAPLLFFASLWLYPAGILMGIGLPLIATGLFMLGVALEQIAPHFESMAILSDPTVGILPLAMALFVAAPLLFVAGLWLFPASLLLGFSLPIIGVAFAWLAWGLMLLTPFMPTMGLLADPVVGILPFAMMAFMAAPFLFFAGLWLLPASMMWFVAASLLAPAMMWLAMAFPMFAIGMMMLIPLIPYLMILAPIMAQLGAGFRDLGIGLDLLWNKVGGWWSDWYYFTYNLSWGLRRIGDSMLYMQNNSDGINAAARLFEVLNNLDETLPDRMMIIATAIRELADALNQIPETKTVALAATLDAFEGAIEAAVKMKPENREGLGEIVAKGQTAAMDRQAAPVAAASDNGMFDKLSGALSSAMSGSGGSSSSKNIVLQVNGRVLGEVVVDLLKEKYDLRVG